MLKNLIKSNYFWLLIIIIACLWQGRYLLVQGLYTFSDESHLANLHQMVTALKSGQFPVRWSPNYSYNYGHPLFIFYYQLPYYIGALFKIVCNLSLMWSFKLSMLFSLILSAVGMFFLSKKFFNQSTSTAISLIYLFTPYRAVDLYVRGAIGEMFAFALMPLTLLAFLNLVKNKNRRSLLLASLSFLLLILSHNITLIIFTPVLLLLSFLYTRSYKSILTAIIISIFLASFYLIPAIIEKNYMQPGTPFNYLDHFPFIKQLIIPYWGYGASVWGPTDQLSFQIGLINIFGILIIFTFLFTSHLKNKLFVAGLLLSTLGSVFMMNIRSNFIWNIIPVADYIQFPWRFLIITTFCTPLLIGFIGQIKKFPIFSKLPIIFAVMAIIFTQSYFKPHKIQNVDDNYYLNRFFINQNTSENTNLLSTVYHLNSEDYLPLTIWTTSRPLSLPSKVEIFPNNSFFKLTSPSPLSYQILTDNNIETKLFLNNYYYPGWTATIDNQPTALFPEGPQGRIAINIPQGNHQIHIYFTNTPLRQIVNIISLVSMALLLIYSFYPSKNDSKI